MNDKKHNPFSALNPRAFPARPRASSAFSDAEPPEKVPANSHDGEDEDARLFLRTMTNGLAALSPSARGNRPSRSRASPLIADASDKAASPERGAESDDFAAAMRDVRPLRSGGRDVAPAPSPGQSAVSPSDSFQELLEKTLEFAVYFSDEYMEGHVLGLDPLILQKLRAGRFKPEAHLDLHGLNARQAFDALIGFTRGSWYKGLRTVLVIPGRGRNSPLGIGVLRERVRLWLSQEPLKRVVLAFCTAGASDGGAGGLYVLLRKYKKKGKICWDRAPADPDV